MPEITNEPRRLKRKVEDWERRNPFNDSHAIKKKSLKR